MRGKKKPLSPCLLEQGWAGTEGSALVISQGHRNSQESGTEPEVVEDGAKGGITRCDMKT